MGTARKNTREPHPEAQAIPAAQEPRHILLAVRDDGRFSQIVQSRLAEAGWDVLLFDNPGQVLGALGEHGVALIILDAALPGAQEAVHQAKLDPQTNRIPIVALFPRGGSPLRPSELRVRADLELAEPLDVRQLLEAAQRQATRCAEAAPAPEREVQFILPSRQADLEQATGLASALLRSSGLGDAAQTSLLAAFREAVGNAIQHGNQRDPAKCVHVRYCQGPDAITIEVRDQGIGFDAQHYLRQATRKDAAEAARDRSRQGGQGGLGILMLLRCTDHVEYNEKGNVVTLTKRLHTAAPGPDQGDQASQEDATT